MDLARILNFPIDKGARMFSLMTEQDSVKSPKLKILKTALSLDDEVMTYFLERNKEKDFRIIIESLKASIGFDANAFYEGANRVFREEGISSKYLDRVSYEMFLEMYKDQMYAEPGAIGRMQFRSI